MSVEMENAIIALVILSVMVTLTMAATEWFCRYRVKRGKPIRYWVILAGASLMPISTAVFGTCSEPDIWWSHAHKAPPSAHLITLGLLGALCTLPASVVVFRFKRRSKQKASGRLTTVMLLLTVLLLGCGSPPHGAPLLHDTAHDARAPYVDIAANLGLKYERDLLGLYDSLTEIDVRCGMRAMSLNAEQIVVERTDFERAKAIVTGLVVRDRLSVRIYKSPDFGKAPETSLLEVWEKGQKVREETYKLYID